MPEEKRELLVNEELMNITRKIFYYGCYTAKDFRETDGIKSTSFNRYKLFLQYVFPDVIEELPVPHSRAKALHFRIDEFENSFNILLDLFTLKRISATEFIFFLKLMYFFTGNNQKKEFSLKTLSTFDVQINGEYISDRTLQRKLQELVNYGYLKRTGKGTFRYSKPESVLAPLDESTLYSLTALTDLCRNIYHPAVCGHYLMDTLSIVNRSKNISYDTIFLCKHLHMGQVLEDGKLWQLLMAIEERKTVSFDYENKQHQKEHRDSLQPCKIIINEADGRRYVFCMDLKNGRNGGVLFRLQHISKLKIEKMDKKNPLLLLSKEETDKIYHDILGKSFAGTCLPRKSLKTATLIYKTDFYYEIQAHFPDAVPEHFDKTHDKIRIEVNSLVELKPWLRRNLGKVRITDTSDDTAEKMEQELQEWRAMYGII